MSDMTVLYITASEQAWIANLGSCPIAISLGVERYATGEWRGKTKEKKGKKRAAGLIEIVKGSLEQAMQVMIAGKESLQG